MTRILTIALLLLPLMTLAQGKIFTTNDGAIRGYDPVAYFTEGKPVAGKKEFSLTWMEATWYFSSQQNLETFKANPEKYAPQFGGFCAFGVSRGYKVKTEPEAWTIIDGKLYLNYNLDVQKEWSKDPSGYILKANGNWLELKDKN
jgi:YHS domain-containing protein